MWTPFGAGPRCTAHRAALATPFRAATTQARSHAAARVQSALVLPPAHARHPVATTSSDPPTYTRSQFAAPGNATQLLMASAKRPCRITSWPPRAHAPSLMIHAHSGKPSCPGAERAAQLRGDARNARAPTAIGAQARPTGEARRSQVHLFLSAHFQPFGITIRLHRPAPSPCCTAVQGNEPLDLVVIRATRGLSSTSTAIGTQARGRQVKRGGQKSHMFLYSARCPPFWITIRLHQPLLRRSRGKQTRRMVYIKPATFPKDVDGTVLALVSPSG